MRKNVNVSNWSNANTYPTEKSNLPVVLWLLLSLLPERRFWEFCFTTSFVTKFLGFYGTDRLGRSVPHIQPRLTSRTWTEWRSFIAVSDPTGHLIIGKYCTHSRALGRSGSYSLLIWLTNSIPRHLLTLGTWTGSVNISQVLSVSISPHLNELVRFKHPHVSNGSTVKPLFFNQPYNIPISPHFQ